MGDCAAFHGKLRRTPPLLCTQGVLSGARPTLRATTSAQCCVWLTGSRSRIAREREHGVPRETCALCDARTLRIRHHHALETPRRFHGKRPRIVRETGPRLLTNPSSGATTPTGGEDHPRDRPVALSVLTHPRRFMGNGSLRTARAHSTARSRYERLFGHSGSGTPRVAAMTPMRGRKQAAVRRSRTRQRADAEH